MGTTARLPLCIIMPTDHALCARVSAGMEHSDHARSALFTTKESVRVAAARDGSLPSHSRVSPAAVKEPSERSEPANHTPFTSSTLAEAATAELIWNKLTGRHDLTSLRSLSYCPES